MEWWKGFDQTRLLIAPQPSRTGNGVGRLLSLRHPKSGNATCYLLVDEALQEIQWFKQRYASWFLEDYVCEDGGLYIATPVDPVFILLPIFDEARMKKGDDLGKFRQVDEIIFVTGYPGYQHLVSIAENCMEVVCEVKEIGSSKFFRLDDSKVLAWLNCKVCQLKEALPLLDKNYAAQDESSTLSDSVTILGEYLKNEPWLKVLCDHLKVNFSEATGKLASENFQAVTESSPLASNLPKEKARSETKSKGNGRHTKKVKLETESKNIKEMFSRASRKKS